MNLNDHWRWNSTTAAHMRTGLSALQELQSNYSQAWQDMFVLCMLKAKRAGKYLEIGAQKPQENSNTYLLEKNFGWTGTSVEIDPAHFQAWMQQRPNAHLVLADALAINYSEAIPLWFGESTTRIDYLQLDIDPARNTLEVLKKLPLGDVRFSVITFETDAYTADLGPRDESRQILRSHGYELIGADVTVLFPPISEKPIPFEDWWVDPREIDSSRIAYLQGINSRDKHPQALIVESK